MTHFYATQAGPDPDALKRAFRKCGELAVAGQHSSITIAVPAKGNLQGIMDEVLGEKAVAILLRDNALPLDDTLTLHLATKQIPARHRGPVLAAWTKIDHVAAIDQSGYATDIVYLPWLDDELAAFQTLFSSALPL